MLSTVRRSVMLALMLLCVSLSGWADKGFDLRFQIRDSLSQTPLMAKTYLIGWQSDSSGKTMIDDITMGLDSCGPNGTITYHFTQRPTGENWYYKLYLKVLDRYEYRVGEKTGIESDKYDQKILEFDIPKDAPNPYTIPVLMRRNKNVELEEFTFTATKVMMYYKGDTLVYNADAFVLSEGSMLNALISKLPGVEVKGKGVIYCNGRRLDKLLINGRDLFNDDNELMLENIAAYTVKDIAVYNKRGRISELVNIHIPDDMEYTMDVRLKREYSIGGSVNAEAGYGTHDRYMARLFGMWFSDFVSMNAYGNLNNLSNTNTPGENDNTLDQSVNSADNVVTTEKGGVNYLAKGYRDKWEVKGNVNIMRLREHRSTMTDAELYQVGGNVWKYQWFDDRDRKFSVSTDHTFFTKLGEKAILEIKPSFSHGQRDRRHSTVSASYRAPAVGISKTYVLESMETRPVDNDSLINFGDNASVTDAITNDAKLKAETNINLFEGAIEPTMLTFYAEGIYKQKHENQFDRYRYVFGNPELSPELSHRFKKNHPDNMAECSAGVKFTHFFDWLTVQLPVEYKFTYRRIRHTTSAYQLNELADYDTGRELDFIPRTELLDGIFEPEQSFRSKETVCRHYFCTKPYNMTRVLLGSFPFKLMVGPEFSMTISERRYDYFYGNRLQQIKNTSVLPNAWLMFHLAPSDPRAHGISLDLCGTVSTNDTPLYLMVDRPSEGLEHFFGTKSIKNTTSYLTFVNFYQRSNGRQHYLHLSYRYSVNSLRMASFYDYDSGNRYIKASYVDGDRRIGADYRLSLPFGKNRNWNFSTETNYAFNKSIGVSMAYSGNADFAGNTPTHAVMEHKVTERLKLQWQKGIFNGSVFADGRFNRYDSWDIGVRPYNVWTVNCGFNGTVSLPYNWSISTDITSYTRCGYAYKSANTTDFVWNARVSKSVCKGAMVFVLDGYDLLRQLSNITYTVNSVERSQVESNVIPSYILFHMQWRFNKKPKKITK